MEPLEEPEEWRDTMFPGYRVSSLGRVRGPKGWILKPRIDDGGYRNVSIYFQGKQYTKTVHNLVCRTWHGESPPSQFQVRHLDGDPSNNRPENLRWGTQSENEYDKADHGSAGRNRGEAHGSAKLTDNEVRWIRYLYAHRLANQYQLALEFGVEQSVVSMIVNHRLWKHIPDVLSEETDVPSRPDN